MILSPLFYDIIIITVWHYQLLYNIITVTLQYYHCFFTILSLWLYDIITVLCNKAVKSDGHQYTSYYNQYIPERNCY